MSICNDVQRLNPWRRPMYEASELSTWNVGYGGAGWVSSTRCCTNNVRLMRYKILIGSLPQRLSPCKKKRSIKDQASSGLCKTSFDCSSYLVELGAAIWSCGNGQERCNQISMENMEIASLSLGLSSHVWKSCRHCAFEVHVKRRNIWGMMYHVSGCRCKCRRGCDRKAPISEPAWKRQDICMLQKMRGTVGLWVGGK